MKPELTMGQRLRRIRGAISQKDFATALGYSLKTVQRYENDETRVEAPYLQAICDLFPSLNPGWLLTGKGDQWPAGENPAIPAINEELLAQIGREIAEVYRVENARISAPQLLELAARWYADLVAVGETEAERTAGLKVMLQQLRRELRSPPSADQANGKRSA